MIPYFGTPSHPECHLLYNNALAASIWSTTATQDVRLLRHLLERLFTLPYETTFLNFLRCNDDIGWTLDYDFLSSLGQGEISHKQFLNSYMTGAYPGSPARGELYQPDVVRSDARICGTTASLCGIEAALQSENADALRSAVDLDIMLHALMLTLSGVPELYSGDELGRLNDYSYHQDPQKADDSRYLHRGRFEWDKAACRHTDGTVEARLFESYRYLLQVRKEHHAFDSNADCWSLQTDHNSVLGLGRYLYGESMAALFNFSAEPVVIDLHRTETCRDLVSGEFVNLSRILIPGHGFRWLNATYYEF